MMRRLQTGDERGQVLVMSVMFMTVLLGAAALALDIGRMAVTRQGLKFVIPAFVCVKITYMGNPSADWTGTIVEKDECASYGLYDGPYEPSIENAYVPVLIK